MSYINIILFEKKLSRFVNLTVRKAVLYIIIAFFVLLIPLTLFLIMTNTQNVVAKNRVRTLTKENQALKNEITIVKSQIDTLNQQLRQLAELDAQIRIAANLELLPRDLRTLGYGGSRENEVAASVDNMIERARLQEKSFKELKKYLDQQQALLQHTPSIWPVSGYLSSSFGYRKSPITGKNEFHNGIDIVAPAGTPIRASAAGRIRFAGFKAGWGRYVEIDHGYGFITCYAHCQSIKVSTGQKVSRGEIIATVGRTGSATGNHLHYGVKVSGAWVNPLNYILSDFASR
ncbi:MAG: peptidoglycan DD-metalloendopeptidase family protein [Candidatus Latescibacteria bacterium]|nr:peptidoglycan DD-metalloendopeptidase family protein [Candidatus Latescibacterota bacterium]